MGALAQAQRAVQSFILGGSGEEAAALIEPDGLDTGRRLQIYRNHFQLSLREALAAVYPVVCQIVDPSFFAWLAHEYVSKHPPRDPRLCAFGDQLPEFIDRFPPCGELPYLSDLARLEWALHTALHAPDERALSPEVLATVSEADPFRLELRFHPSVRYIRSGVRIDAIWLAHQDQAPPGELNLSERPVHLEVRCVGNEVGFREIARGPFVFRSALQAAATLGLAAEGALSIEPEMDVQEAVEAVFTEGLVTAVVP